MPESTPEPDEWGWLRVTDKDTGHKYSIRESQLPHGNYTVLKADASNPNTGDPLPPEHNAVKPTAPAPSGQSAETQEK
jgi:hypothetical protein